MTVGVFDLFHSGHLNLLERASELGTLIVGVPTSEGAFRAKGERPIMSFEDRFRTINALKCVDMAIGFFDNTQLDKLIEFIQPDLWIRGDDWKEFPGFTKLKKMKVPIKYLPYTLNISSSLIKDKICSEQCEKQKKY